MDTSRLEVVQMEYNAANRLTKYNGQEVQYDAKGNMVYGPVDGTMQHLTYDCRNRLVEAGGISYEYDAENTRTASVCGKKRTEYVTDTSGSLSRLLLAYEADGTTTSYAYGAEGLTAQYNSGTEQNLLYHYDNIGSTTLLTNLTGTIIERFAYGTYGELLQKAKNAVRFLYNGSYGVVTDENGLYYMRARYYNPDIKRFLNQDIKVGDISNGQGLNRYAYCEGNPVSMVDPFGLSPQISQDQTSRFSVLHNILDLAGLALDAADVINAAFYAAEGDWTNAALCAVAVIPIAGSAIAGAAKGTKAVVKAKKAEKILELAEESCKMTRNASDRLDVFSDVMKASSKWGNSPVKLMDGITAETGSRAIKALETGGDFGRESKRAVQELKAVAGAEGIHLKPSVSRKVDVFKDSFVKTEKKVKTSYGESSGNISELLENRQELTGTNREKLLSMVQDTKLAAYINEVYRPGASVGDGGTADKLIMEFYEGSSRHLPKAKERLVGINRIIDSGKLGLNDLDIAEALRDDLEYAIDLFK